MKCDDDIVKCMVFWTNLCLALVGMSLISIGIIYKITFNELGDAIPVQYQGIIIIPVLIIPLGTVLIVIAVFGCYGCLTEKINFIALFTVVLLVVFVLQVSVGVCSLVHLGDDNTFQENLKVNLKDLFDDYKANNNNRKVVDLIQHRLKCCWLYDQNDWDLKPETCYKTDSKEVFINPCYLEVLSFLKNCMFIIGISVILLSIIEVIGLTISFHFLYYLTRKINNRFRECGCIQDHNYNYEDRL